jgi:hypothetical protein
MKISETFSGTYFKAADFPNPRTFVIEAVTSATFDEGQKPAVRFHGETQQLVLNKTNGFALANAFGDDTDAWHGHQVQVFAVPTFYQGRPTKGICVQPVTPQGNANPQTPSATSSQRLAPQSVAQQLRPNQGAASQQPASQAETSFQAPRIDYEA